MVMNVHCKMKMLPSSSSSYIRLTKG